MWVDNAKRVEQIVWEDYVLYGELIGAIPNGKLIQKGYDYGMDGDYNFIVYKIINNADNKNSLTYDEIVQYCVLANTSAEILQNTPYRLKPAKLFYQGTVGEISKKFEGFSDDPIENLFKGLKSEIEIMEPLCKNKVPREGYVIRIENEDRMKTRQVFKLKSFLFKKYEDEQIEPTIEDEN